MPRLPVLFLLAGILCAQTLSKQQKIERILDLEAQLEAAQLELEALREQRRSNAIVVWRPGRRG